MAQFLFTSTSFQIHFIIFQSSSLSTTFHFGFIWVFHSFLNGISNNTSKVGFLTVTFGSHITHFDLTSQLTFTSISRA
jgi:hypothetical protein